MKIKTKTVILVSQVIYLEIKNIFNTSLKNYSHLKHFKNELNQMLYNFTDILAA